MKTYFVLIQRVSGKKLKIKKMSDGVFSLVSAVFLNFFKGTKYGKKI